jgi:hypothetical protein
LLQRHPRRTPCKAGQAIIFRLAALSDWQDHFMRSDNVRRYWMLANYLAAIVLATIGWIWLMVWIAKRLIYPV